MLDIPENAVFANLTPVPDGQVGDASIYEQGLALVLRCRIFELVGQVVQMRGVNPGGYIELLAGQDFVFIDHKTGEKYLSHAFALSAENILPL